MNDLSVLYNASGLFICEDTALITADTVTVITNLTVTVSGLCRIGTDTHYISGLTADDHTVTYQYFLVIRFLGIASVYRVVDRRILFRFQTDHRSRRYYRSCINGWCRCGKFYRISFDGRLLCNRKRVVAVKYIAFFCRIFRCISSVSNLIIDDRAFCCRFQCHLSILRDGSFGRTCIRRRHRGRIGKDQPRNGTACQSFLIGYRCNGE